MSIDIPPPPSDEDAARIAADPGKALDAAVFGGLDAIKAAKLAAQTFTPLDERLAALERNDFGNGQRLKERFGHHLMFVKDVGWFAWAKTHWSIEDGEVTAARLADETHTAMYAEAKAIAERGAWPKEQPNEFAERVGALLGWAHASGNVNKRHAMLASAATYLSKGVKELDVDKFYFNCENCTLDLTDHTDIKKRRHNPRDLITHTSPVKFDPKAEAPTFRKFIDRVLPDKDVQLFVQQYAGICLTGDISIQALVINYGTGANGKSTLAEVLRYILGDYAKIVAFTSLLRDDKRRGSEASPDLARLRGARAAFASEPEQSVKFSEAMIKQLTGGQPITARELNKGFFEYLPEFKLYLDLNTKPVVQGMDHGIWRRMILVPWLVTIPKEDRDPLLLEKLKAEASGVLNWMLDGFRHWRDKGLVTPKAVVDATESYKTESDKIGGFIDAAIERDPKAKEQASVLFDAYKRWCRANAVFEVGQTLFGRRMSEEFEKSKSGVQFYIGVRLKAEWRHSAAGGDVGDPPPPQDGDPGNHGQGFE